MKTIKWKDKLNTEYDKGLEKEQILKKNIIEVSEAKISNKKA